MHMDSVYPIHTGVLQWFSTVDLKNTDVVSLIPHQWLQVHYTHIFKTAQPHVVTDSRTEMGSQSKWHHQGYS